MRTMSMKSTAPHLRRIGVSACALMLAALAAAQETSAPPTPPAEGPVQEGEAQETAPPVPEWRSSGNATTMECHCANSRNRGSWLAE